jgi:UDP-N-acetyl-D-mannosaminouronate:lipid I N-acetyl-D-mannosaminouronosyltransferase
MKYQIINSIYCYTPSSRKELIDYAFANKSILVAVNAEKILKSTIEMQDIINRNIGYPDGVGAVWVLQKKGFKDVVKIPGCELWLDIIQQHVSDKSFYILGGKEEVIQETVSKLKTDYPQINIVGYRNGYIQSEEEKHALMKDIAAKSPDVVFVATGSPNQELLMNELHSLHPAVYMGLGGSFDIYVAKVNRAPNFWITNNLEWLYRLIKEPFRLKRQLRLIEFYFKFIFNKL